MTLSGTITAAALQAEFQAIATLIDTSHVFDIGDFNVPLRLATLADTTTERDRSIAFTPQDDYEVRGLFLRVTDSGGAGRVVTASLTQADGITSYLLDKTISVSVTSIAGTVDSRPTGLDLRTTTGTRIRLVKGVRYRLSALCSTVGTVTGPVEVWLQLRSVRRGDTAFLSCVPHRFADGGVLDGDRIGDNIRTLRDEVARSQARRRVHSFHVIDFDGVTNTSAQVLREYAQRMVTAGSDYRQIEAFELVIYATDAVTWTATPSETASPAVSAVGDGATVEVLKRSAHPFPVDDAAADNTITLAASAASTITRGYLVVHESSDRYMQDGLGQLDQVVYLPTAAETNPVGAINTSLTNIDAAVDESIAKTQDIRYELVSARAVSGTSVTWRLPSGLRNLVSVQGWAVGPAAHTARIAVNGNNLDIGTTGSTNRVYGEAAPAVNPPNDPTDTTDDTLVVLSRQAGASPIDLIVALIGWKL